MKRFIAIGLLAGMASLAQAVSVQDLLNQGKVKVKKGVLDLSNMNIDDLNGLQHVPNPLSITAIKLPHNNISVVKEKFLEPFKNLKNLDLSHNKIVDLTDDEFEDNKLLETLNLAYNRIATITKDTFNDLHSLKEVDLSFNNLTLPKFKGSAFHDTTQNIKVKLTGNPILQRLDELKKKMPKIRFVVK